MPKESEAEQIRHIGASPTRISSPELRHEARKALVWTLVVGFVILTVYLAQSLLVIFGAMVFGAMIDGGARLIGRWLKVGRMVRVAIVLILASAFIVWLFYFAGSTISREAAAFPAIIERQVGELFDWAQKQGFDVHQQDLNGLVGNLASGVGTVTKAIGGIVGGFTTMFLIAIIGIYFALDPNLYERGFAWIISEHRRDAFHDTLSHQAATLRRLLAGRLFGMAVEGFFTWAMLALYGVPMAALLGLLTGLLAFIPNIGALVSGVLMVLVGFSGGTDMGIYTIFVYFAVQTIDGYVLIPLIAKKTVDLAPALVLAAQLIFGVLFGLLGLALADPMLAMIKVALERRSVRIDQSDASNKVIA
ncbi:MAG: AI-2E family transporter [Sphingomonadales bacterium]|nr:AI-2E family transporter [Sphingomonadales bacterium]MBD3773371.1 AI-2E family transporter [Paracoccaceae bacterium]